MIEAFADTEILSQLKLIRDREVSSVVESLLYLKEVRDRRLALKRGYNSLYAFCMSELSYSKDEAYARIRAVELASLSPQILEHVEHRRLGITCLKQAQVMFKRENKRRRNAGAGDLTVEEKLAVVEKLAGSSTRDVRRILAEEFPLLHEVKQGEDPLPDGRTLIAAVFEEAEFAEYKRFKDVSSHQLESFETKDVLLCAIRIGLRANDPLYKKAPAARPKAAASSRDETPTAPNANQSSRGEKSADETPPAQTTKPPAFEKLAPKRKRKYISVIILREVIRRSNGRCEYVDDDTGRRCDCTWGLETDHILPLALGGTDDPANLRRVCGVHNRYLAETMGLRRPESSMFN